MLSTLSKILLDLRVKRLTNHSKDMLLQSNSLLFLELLTYILLLVLLLVLY